MNLKEMTKEDIQKLINEARAELAYRESESAPKKIVTIEASERFKAWAKVLKNVNTNKSTGYAFEGDFVKVNQSVELPIGTFILVYEELGSVKNRCYSVQVLKVTESGLEETGVRYANDKYDWAVSIRDAAAALLGSN